MKTVSITFIAAACFVVAGAAWTPDADAAAGCGGRIDCGKPNCCADCGSKAACRKVTCRIVCDTKKVTKTIWSCRCEPYCLPLPACAPRGGACKGHGSCEAGCGDPGGCACQTPSQCGKLRCRKKLLKKEVEVEVPIYKCVVKYLCPGCSVEEGPQAEDTPKKAPPRDAPHQVQRLLPAPLPPVSVPFSSGAG